MPTPKAGSFRERFVTRKPLIGTFIKTPTSHTIEILGALGFDFVVIDEEHAPFDRVTTDQAILAARATGIAGIVRVPEANAALILGALDGGAAGVLVPHVSSGAKAREVAAACRYRGGKRGFANTTRAGNFGGLGFLEHAAEADATVTVIAMIEDIEAIDAVEEIVAVDGIDGVFIGRGDLSAAYGANSMDDPRVLAAAEKIAKASRAAGKPVCMMAATYAEAKGFMQMGASAFIISSDHGLMRQAAMRVIADFAPLKA
jgi:staphyloferrin B biosynthesis citrate synthase